MDYLPEILPADPAAPEAYKVPPLKLHYGLMARILMRLGGTGFKIDTREMGNAVRRRPPADGGEHRHTRV